MRLRVIEDSHYKKTGGSRTEGYEGQVNELMPKVYQSKIEAYDV